MSVSDFISEIKDQVQDIRRNFGYPNDGTAFGHFALRECLSKIMDLGDVAEPDLDSFIKSRISDGPDDKGIDAVVVEADGTTNFFQFKYSDWNQYNKEEFKKTLDFFDTLLGINKTANGYHLEIECNAKLKQIVNEDVTSALAKGVSQRMHYVGAYFEPDLLSTIDNLRQHFQRNGANLTFATHQYDELQTLYANIVLPRNEIKLTYVQKEFFVSDGTFHLNGKAVEVRKLVASITAESLKEALDNNGLSLFDLNVRFFKGFGGDVNKSIKKEYERGANSNFWFLNNGINAICRNFNYDEGILTTKDFQIANGCQTSKALQDVLDVDPSITILLRLTAITDSVAIENISSQIAIASNKQNPISNRDLHANDSVQRHIFDVLDKKDIFYDCKESSWKGALKSKYRVGKYSYNKIKNVDIAISFMSLFLQTPVLSKGREKIAFSDEADYYSRIFDESQGVNSLVMKLMLAYRLRELIERLKEKHTAKYPYFLDASYSTDILLALLGIGLLKLEKLSPSKDIEKVKAEEQRLDVSSFINDNYELIQEDRLEKVFEFIAEKTNDYLTARRDASQDLGDMFNLQNWLKVEGNYLTLVDSLEPKIAGTSF